MTFILLYYYIIIKESLIYDLSSYINGALLHYSWQFWEVWGIVKIIYLLLSNFCHKTKFFTMIIVNWSLLYFGVIQLVYNLILQNRGCVCGLFQNFRNYHGYFLTKKLVVDCCSWWVLIISRWKEWVGNFLPNFLKVIMLCSIKIPQHPFFFFFTQIVINDHWALVLRNKVRDPVALTPCHIHHCVKPKQWQY